MLIFILMSVLYQAELKHDANTATPTSCTLLHGHSASIRKRIWNVSRRRHAAGPCPGPTHEPCADLLIAPTLLIYAYAGRFFCTSPLQSNAALFHTLRQPVAAARSLEGSIALTFSRQTSSGWSIPERTLRYPLPQKTTRTSRTSFR